ncbi:TPA: hypothetical protein ACH3X1_000280 [Trebouxia sp. C0004]
MNRPQVMPGGGLDRGAWLPHEIWAEVPATFDLKSLDAVVIRNASPCTNSTLAAFASITTVDLHFPGALDLSLQTFYHLRELHLDDGVFAVDGLAAHVTDLFLDHAVVTSAQSCSFVTGLQTLYMYASSFVGLHPLGLSACTALTWLQLHDAEIGAEVQTKHTNIRPS